MATPFNMVRVRSATVGLGALTLGPAITGFLTPALASVPNGATVSYSIFDYDGAGNHIASEWGRGVYNAVAITLTRNVLGSTNGGALVNLTGNEHVFITVLAEDLDHASGSIANVGTNTHVQIDSHIANVANPHSVTAAQVGAYTTLQSDTLFQPKDATLTSISALGTAANKMLYTTGVDAWAEADISAFGRSLIDDADAAAAIVTLGLASLYQPLDADLTAIAALGFTSTAFLKKTAANTWTLDTNTYGDISGTGVVGQVAEFVTNTKTLQAAKIIGPAANILTLTNAAASTLALNITAAKTLTLTAADNYALTVPATGTAALLGTTNVFTVAQMVDGTADAIQLRVQGHSTQTSNIATFEKSDGTVYASIGGTGALTISPASASYSLIVTPTGSGVQSVAYFKGVNTSYSGVVFDTANTTAHPFFQFNRNGTYKGFFAMDTSDMFYYANASSVNKLTIAQDGTTTIGTGTVMSGAGITLGLDTGHTDGKNILFGTTTGTKIGTATSQKLSLWNATPIVQPTTGVAAATFVANTSGIVNDTATFDGYTIGQVVKALRNIGALA